MPSYQTTEARCLGDFAGRWKLVRHITPAEGAVAHFEGTAVWSAARRGLICSEKGFVTLEGHVPMRAERRYLWAPDLRVYFDDGRYFHQVPPLGGPADHWCDPDQYDGEYDFSDWPGFRVIWDVKGPHKDYRSVSQYQRA